ncbi:MAG: alpha/beta hydrolase [Pseudomonadota bacterium]
MKRAFKWIGIILGSLVLLVAALAAGLYVSTRGEIVVPATVVDDPSLPRIAVGGVLLHAEAFGDPGNPPIIVLHGGPGGDYRGLLDLAGLGDEFFVVFYDQRGSGLSERLPDAQYTLDLLIQELDGVVDRYGRGRKVHLVGHSWGAMLAAAYLGRHPDKVARAVLAEPGFLTTEIMEDFMTSTGGMRPPLTPGNLWKAANIFFRSLHVDGPDDDAARDWLVANMMTSDVEGNPVEGYWCGGKLENAALPTWRHGARVMPAMMAAAKDADGTVRLGFTDGLETFKGPVLLLAGACNALIGPEHQRRHLPFFKNVKLLVISGVGHSMFGERPEELRSVVGSFLSR